MNHFASHLKRIADWKTTTSCWMMNCRDWNRASWTSKRRVNNFVTRQHSFHTVATHWQCFCLRNCHFVYCYTRINCRWQLQFATVYFMIDDAWQYDVVCLVYFRLVTMTFFKRVTVRKSFVHFCCSVYLCVFCNCRFFESPWRAKLMSRYLICFWLLQ